MADSTLAALGAHTPIVDADSSYIENGGVAKKVAASVWKTYVSASPTLVTPNIGTPSAGVISACTSSGLVLVAPVLGTPASGDLSNCTGGPTLTSATLVTPALGTVATGDISACTSTSLTMVTPVLGTVTSGDISACTSTSMTMVTPVLGTVTSGDVSACTSTSQTFVTPVLGTPASGVLTNCTGAPTFTLAKRSVETGITADVGSIQGGSPITKDVNIISVCGNVGDAITLPAAVAGLEITIANNGANAADVFPAAGDDCGAGVNAAVSLAAAANITYIAVDGTTWFAKT